jgi:hypothetical protein
LLADRRKEPELFWALRGGGGSFGVVTAIELRLFPITEVYAGILWFPIDRGAEVFHAWRELTAGVMPDELTTVGRYLQLELPDISSTCAGATTSLPAAGASSPGWGPADVNPAQGPRAGSGPTGTPTPSPGPRPRPVPRPKHRGHPHHHRLSVICRSHHRRVHCRIRHH